MFRVFLLPVAVIIALLNHEPSLVYSCHLFFGTSIDDDIRLPSIGEELVYQPSAHLRLPLNSTPVESSMGREERRRRRQIPSIHSTISSRPTIRATGVLRSHRTHQIRRRVGRSVRDTNTLYSCTRINANSFSKTRSHCSLPTKRRCFTTKYKLIELECYTLFQRKA